MERARPGRRQSGTAATAASIGRAALTRRSPVLAARSPALVSHPGRRGVIIGPFAVSRRIRGRNPPALPAGRPAQRRRTTADSLASFVCRESRTPPPKIFSENRLTLDQALAILGSRVRISWGSSEPQTLFAPPESSAELPLFISTRHPPLLTTELSFDSGSRQPSTTILLPPVLSIAGLLPLLSHLIRPASRLLFLLTEVADVLRKD